MVKRYACSQHSSVAGPERHEPTPPGSRPNRHAGRPATFRRRRTSLSGKSANPVDPNAVTPDDPRSESVNHIVECLVLSCLNAPLNDTPALDSCDGHSAKSASQRRASGKLYLESRIALNNFLSRLDAVHGLADDQTNAADVSNGHACHPTCRHGDARSLRTTLHTQRLRQKNKHEVNVAVAARYGMQVKPSSIANHAKKLRNQRVSNHSTTTKQRSLTDKGKQTGKQQRKPFLSTPVACEVNVVETNRKFNQHAACIGSGDSTERKGVGASHRSAPTWHTTHEHVVTCLGILRDLTGIRCLAPKLRRLLANIAVILARSAFKFNCNLQSPRQNEAVNGQAKVPESRIRLQRTPVASDMYGSYYSEQCRELEDIRGALRELQAEVGVRRKDIAVVQNVIHERTDMMVNVAKIERAARQKREMLQRSVAMLQAEANREEPIQAELGAKLDVLSNKLAKLSQHQYQVIQDSKRVQANLDASKRRFEDYESRLNDPELVPAENVHVQTALMNELKEEYNTLDQVYQFKHHTHVEMLRGVQSLESRCQVLTSQSRATQDEITTLVRQLTPRPSRDRLLVDGADTSPPVSEVVNETDTVTKISAGCFAAHEGVAGAIDNKNGAVKSLIHSGEKNVVLRETGGHAATGPTVGEAEEVGEPSNDDDYDDDGEDAYEDDEFEVDDDQNDEGSSNSSNSGDKRIVPDRNEVSGAELSPPTGEGVGEESCVKTDANDMSAIETKPTTKPGGVAISVVTGESTSQLVDRLCKVIQERELLGGGVAELAALQTKLERRREDLLELRERRRMLNQKLPVKNIILISGNQFAKQTEVVTQPLWTQSKGVYFRGEGTNAALPRCFHAEGIIKVYPLTHEDLRGFINEAWSVASRTVPTTSTTKQRPGMGRRVTQGTNHATESNKFITAISTYYKKKYGLQSAVVRVTYSLLYWAHRYAAQDVEVGLFLDVWLGKLPLRTPEVMRDFVTYVTAYLHKINRLEEGERATGNIEARHLVLSLPLFFPHKGQVELKALIQAVNALANDDGTVRIQDLLHDISARRMENETHQPARSAPSSGVENRPRSDPSDEPLEELAISKWFLSILKRQYLDSIRLSWTELLEACAAISSPNGNCTLDQLVKMLRQVDKRITPKQEIKMLAWALNESLGTAEDIWADVTKRTVRKVVSVGTVVCNWMQYAAFAPTDSFHPDAEANVETPAAVSFLFRATKTNTNTSDSDSNAQEKLGATGDERESVTVRSGTGNVAVDQHEENNSDTDTVSESDSDAEVHGDSHR